MTTTAYFENVLIDALCDLGTIAALPLQAIGGLVWALVAFAALLWGCRRQIVCTLAMVAFVAACWACPLLPLGLAITAVVGWATMPKGARHAKS